MTLHIALVTGSIFSRRAGIERICALLANEMVARGHRVTLFTEPATTSTPVYPLDPAVRVQVVSPYTGKHAEIRKLREELRDMELDVCVVMTHYLFWMVALLGSGVPCVYSENSCPEYYEKMTWNRVGRLAAMSGADCIHQLLPTYFESVPDFLRDRIVCIHNPAPSLENMHLPQRSAGPPYILASLGRITPVKQIPLLIQAFGLLYERFPDWQLHIWGQEWQESGTAKRIAASPASKMIWWHGQSDNPLQVFIGAHIFCIPSVYEGFPFTVVEAMACGTPTVGFAACPGVNHLIQDGKNGLLAPVMTPENLAETLARLMGNASLRSSLEKGCAETTQHYAPASFFDQWEKMLHHTAKYKGRTRMDAFIEEPFASQARLSAAARREWVYRNFGEPMPGTFAYYKLMLQKKLSVFWNTPEI